MPTFLPWDLIRFIVSVKNWQFEFASWPLHEHPELGFVSTSIHTVEYNPVLIPATI